MSRSVKAADREEKCIKQSKGQAKEREEEGGGEEEKEEEGGE